MHTLYWKNVSNSVILLWMALQVSANQWSEITNTIQKNVKLVENATNKPLSSTTESATLSDFMTNITKNLLNSKYQDRTDINDELHQDILYMYHKIEYDLQEIVNIFNARSTTKYYSDNIRQKRRAPHSQPLLCTVSKDKLLGLKNKINDVLSNGFVVQRQREIECEFSSKASNNCDELIKLIQCGIKQIVDSINDSNSFDDAARWKNVYEELLEKYAKEIENLKQSISGKYEQELNTLKKDLQKLKKVFEELLEQMKRTTIKLCILELSRGCIQSAIRNYQELRDDSKLSDIIETAYIYYGNLSNVQNILDFIWNLPHISNKIQGYKKTFEVMHNYGHLSNYHVIIVAEKIQETIKLETNFYLQNLKSQVDKYSHYIIKTWAYKILNNDYKVIVEFCREHYTSFNFIIDQLIENAYANNLRHAKPIIKFVRNLPYIESSILAYSYLFDNLKNNNDLDSTELLMLAYRVKEYTEMENYPAVSQNYKNKFLSLINNFPSSVKHLIWDGNSCTIKNLAYNEYLYAATYYHAFTRNSRNIFTWKPGNVDEQGYWEIKSRENGEVFTIRNTKYNEYLYAASDNIAYDYKRRRIFTWIPGGEVTQGFWEIKPYNNSECFTIKNKAHEEYLYAANYYHLYNSNRRRIFTWRPGEEVTQGYWILYC